MFYSSADRKAFRDEAVREGRRIQQLISLHSGQTGRAIYHLMKFDLLSKEDLLGIENLITKDAAGKALKERRDHVALVLRVQKEMREMNDESVDKLAKFLMHSSSNSVHAARLRAALAGE